MSRTYMGVDPGVSPAVGIISPSGCRVLRISRSGPFTLDLYELAQVIDEYRPTFTVVEQMTPVSGQGLSSTAALMACWGSILGLLHGKCNAAYECVQPSVWKDAVFSEKERGLNIKDKAARKKFQKQSAIAYCKTHFPSVSLIANGCRTPDHNMAEALILASYARMLNA